MVASSLRFLSELSVVAGIFLAGYGVLLVA